MGITKTKDAVMDLAVILSEHREYIVSGGNRGSQANLSNLDLKYANLKRAILCKANLSKANLSCAILIDANLRGANMMYAKLSYVKLSGAILCEANLSGANLSGAHLIGTNLMNADLSGADLWSADLSGADLRNADLRNANLSGADLSGADLSGTKGLASKFEEIKEAQRILNILDSLLGSLDMTDWHTCETTHCLAGWCEPNEKLPGSKASRKMPTLAKYFFSTNDKAMKALIKVASGVESVWN